MASEATRPNQLFESSPPPVNIATPRVRKVDQRSQVPPIIISQADALELDLMFFFTGKLCKRGHASYRYVSGGHCEECIRVPKVSRRADNASPYVVISRASARAAGEKYYFTGKTCRNGHIAQRNVGTGACVMCRRSYAAVAHAADPLAAEARGKRWSEKNPASAAASKGRSAALKQAPHKHLQVPEWAPREEIEAIYAEAQRLKLVTGVRHDVDHIAPWLGKDSSGRETVCGLHVPANLQIISASENKRKGRRFEPQTIIH